MRKSAWLFIFVTSFASGIGIRSVFPAGAGSDFGALFIFPAFLIALGLVFILVNLFPRVRTAPGMLIVALVLVSSGIGALRVDVANLEKGNPVLDAALEQRVVLNGFIADIPDIRETHTKLTVEIERIETDGDSRAAESRALVITEHFPEFRYGDYVRLVGELEKPINFSPDPNNPGRPFDYVSFLEKDGIFYQMFYPDIERVGTGKGNLLLKTLFSFKESLIDSFDRVIPEPHSSLLSGILLGTKQALGDELLGAFRAVGIIHIVVLSGYNVTIVADGIGRFFSLLPIARTATIALSGTGVVLFALATGGATVARASLMALLVLLARLTGRLYEILIALFVAGFMMLFWNPKILVFDPSFQLSFMATFGLIVLAPYLDHVLRWVPTKFQIREFVIATIATQLFVLPLLLYMMGEVSLVSVPVNILILPTIPLVMLSGFFTALMGFIHEFAALPLAYISYSILEYQMRVVDIFSSFPFAQVTVAGFSLLAAVAVYASYAALLLIFRKHRNFRMSIRKIW